MAAAAAACLALMLLLPCAAAVPSGPSSARPDAAGSAAKLRRDDSPRTTADSEPHQHFQAPANSHLPAQMDFAEFTRRFVDRNLSTHDPAHADYRPFALPPPALRQGAEPRAVFDTLDADQSGTLSVAELKKMAELEQLVQMPEPSEAGIREGYFGAQYGELLQPVRHTPPCRHAELLLTARHCWSSGRGGGRCLRRAGPRRQRNTDPAGDGGSKALLPRRLVTATYTTRRRTPLFEPSLCTPLASCTATRLPTTPATSQLHCTTSTELSKRAEQPQTSKSRLSARCQTNAARK
eukprot:COSAG04_NODE_927_length_9368_cov_4.472543_3_plen_294_part_00